MNGDTAQFFKFLSAILIPALVAGMLTNSGAHGGFVASLWLVSTLLAIGYVVDGLKGAKALLAGTFQSWAILLIAGLLIGSLVAAKFGYSP
jgi:hypothetical protein